MKTKTIKKEFKCFKCKETKSTPITDVGTGYGRDNKGHKICYECCAKLDAEMLINLKKKDKCSLYLHNNTVINWPGTLQIPISFLKKGDHNIARTRTDVWFSFDKFNYHGVQYGYNNEVCHIRKIN